MSKIEKALKMAGELKAGKKSAPELEKERRRRNRRADEASNNLPVLARLRPGVRHDLSPRVLDRHHLIHDGIAEDVLIQYKMLRTKILQQFNTNEWTSLAVTSPKKGAGVTTTAINIAMALSLHGTRDVTLVDFNLRDPSIADYLGLPTNVPGLRSYLESEVPATAIYWDVGIENLSVLASRDRIKDSSEQLMSVKLRELASAFNTQGRNPLVVYDLPPVLTTDDAVAIAPLMDAFLLVVSEGETERGDVDDAIEALAATNVTGVILNKISRRRAI